MSSRRRLAISFFALVAIDALIYWLVWIRHPDYFIVQQEVNVYPLRDLEELLWTEEITSPPVQLVGLSELSAKTVQVMDSARRIRREKTDLHDFIQHLESRVAAVTATLEEKRAKRIDEYSKRELAPLQGETQPLTTEIAQIESLIASNPDRYNSLQVMLAERRLQLAQLDYRIAKKRLEVATRTLNEYGQFAPPEEMDQWRRLEDQTQRARGRLETLDGRWRNLRQAGSELLADWRANRVGRLGIVDFFYFSVSASTTATFGDIIPNHTIVRALVSGQLLLSIVLAGLFVNSLSSELARRRQGSPP
jgi:hypothetical protein